jgi:hypothetical protein
MTGGSIIIGFLVYRVERCHDPPTPRLPCILQQPRAPGACAPQLRGDLNDLAVGSFVLHLQNVVRTAFRISGYVAELAGYPCRYLLLFCDVSRRLAES